MTDHPAADPSSPAADSSAPTLDSPAPTPDETRVRVAFPAAAPAPGPGGHPEPGTEARTLPGIALVTIDRPRALNALDGATIDQLAEAFERLDADPACRCIVLTGAGDRAFAAGADIREMAAESAAGLYASDHFARWDRLARVRTPTIAAVRGYALGGGCELAMSCDMIVAADDAVFGQPELRLGVIPGAGGTQRLTRALGKAKAMELVLTGRNLPAVEAEAHGLVSRLVPAEQVVAAALNLATQVAAMPPLAVAAAVEAIRAAEELPLSAGLALERRLFYLLFGSDDQKEGMSAFLEKRRPQWTGR
jgi:enoyl-CoA hydratase